MAPGATQLIMGLLRSPQKGTDMALRRALLTLLTLSTLLLAISLAMPLGAAEPPTLAAAGLGDIYLALGDSLATGDEEPSNTAAEGDLPGYPAYLSEMLNQTLPISYTNLGVSGETSSSMLAPGGQLDAAVAFIGTERAAGRRVSPVTLSIGGNDMVNVLLGSTTTVTDALTLYRANLEQILDRLVLALDEGGEPSGDLLLMNYYNPYPNLAAFVPPGQLNADPDRDVPRFNQIIAEAAAARGLTVVDAYAAFLGREASLTFVRFPYNLDPTALRRNFDYHPREAGHRVLASGFADATGYVLKRLWVPVVQ
jgi:lysophospholipase L1-like esterase